MAFAIGDTAAGYAAQTYLTAGSDVLTVELKVNYLAPAVGQTLRAVGTVIRSGRRITVVSDEVFAIDGGYPVQGCNVARDYVAVGEIVFSDRTAPKII